MSAELTEKQQASLKRSELKLARALRRAEKAMSDYLDVCFNLRIRGTTGIDDSRVRLMRDCNEYAGWLERRHER